MTFLETFFVRKNRIPGKDFAKARGNQSISGSRQSEGPGWPSTTQIQRCGMCKVFDRFRFQRLEAGQKQHDALLGGHETGFQSAVLSTCGGW